MLYQYGSRLPGSVRHTDRSGIETQRFLAEHSVGPFLEQYIRKHTCFVLSLRSILIELEWRKTTMITRCTTLNYIY